MVVVYLLGDEKVCVACAPRLFCSALSCTHKHRNRNKHKKNAPRDELEALARRRAVGLAPVADKARQQSQRRLVGRLGGLKVVGQRVIEHDRLCVL